LIDLYEQHRAAGLEVIMVSAEPTELLKRYVEARKIPFRVLSDPQREVQQTYGVGSVPFTLLIDREGKIATGLAGYGYSKFMDEFVPAVEAVIKG
jgi:peroxiredoxin